MEDAGKKRLDLNAQYGHLIAQRSSCCIRPSTISLAWSPRLHQNVQPGFPRADRRINIHIRCSVRREQGKCQDISLPYLCTDAAWPLAAGCPTIAGHTVALGFAGIPQKASFWYISRGNRWYVWSVIRRKEYGKHCGSWSHDPQRRATQICSISGRRKEDAGNIPK